MRGLCGAEAARGEERLLQMFCRANMISPIWTAGLRGLFVQQLSRTPEFGPNVFLLGETIGDAENSFGVV